MKRQQLPLAGPRVEFAPLRFVGRALEAIGWAAFLAGIELLARHLPGNDVTALGLWALVLLPAGATAVWLARRGWLPGTRALLGGLGPRLVRQAERLVPRVDLALRQDPNVRPQPDRVLLLPIAFLALAVVAAGWLGPSLARGLDLLRTDVSAVLWLAALGVLWLALLGVLTLGFALQVQVVGLVLAALLTFLGVATAAVLPGMFFGGAVLAMGLLQSLRLTRRPLAPYVFARRSRSGVVRTVRAQTMLRRLHLVCTFALGLIAILGNTQRLFEPGLPRTAYPFSTCLGLLACFATVWLMARADLHFGRLLCVRGEPPETPLVPTLLWRGRGAPPPEARAVEGLGWVVTDAPATPADAYDLEAGGTTPGPRTARLDAGLKAADQAFRLRRRMDVVYRRELYRRLEVLLKVVRPGRRQGTGTLFCPHSWLIPSLLRDTGRSALPVGPTFREVFSARLRRYLGGVLRALQVDLVYWEDGVRFADVKRVLSVAFECFDQGRLPLEARHFAGLPRVWVHVQQEDGPGAEASPQPAGLPKAPVGTGARVLVILRERGGDPRRAEVEAPSDRRPAPMAG